MSKLSKKLKIFQNSTNKTYNVNLYSTKAEALNSPFKITLSDGTTAYVPSRPAKTDTPLAFTYKNKTYYVTSKAEEIIERTTIVVDMTNDWWTCPEGVEVIKIESLHDGYGWTGQGVNNIVKVTPNKKYRFWFTYYSPMDNDEWFSDFGVYNTSQEKILWSNSGTYEDGEEINITDYIFKISYSSAINKMTPEYYAD